MFENNKVPVITLDGPSGTGKGTISLKLAKALGWNFLDSGALYRVLAYAAQQAAILSEDVSGLVKLATAMSIEFQVRSENTSRVFLNHSEVSEAIRSSSCGQTASKIAAIPEVRAALLDRQRAFAKPPGLVTDGRDMGTVVFPDAVLKIYLDATPEERGRRRYLQLKETENDVSLAQVVEELSQRDERDTARAHSPLKPASDAVVIDTTRLTIVQVFDHVLQLAKQRLSTRMGGD